ncbi:MAG: SpoIIE family protein phosphatase [Melioribacteraceae bacterium]|nr:SpoIIE family protein phosphatase [Melioribacteraceae bacterium]MCF8356201.1 SpoIIE family protein phosphatase [Melioribacteraceae bacterium]MCF8396495.1 SpoIIE family protein phosphatase [Melioribacteraceae bacterium]MCF8420052.1 SpoIIE family protein phosphatase [Melioribacteraceae bacterium]
MTNKIPVECQVCEFYEELVQRLAFFQSITNEIMAKKPLDDLLDDIIESSKSLLSAEACTLYLYDKENKNLYFHIVSGPKNVNVDRKTVPIGEGIAGWVGKNKKPLLIDDCYSDERFNAEYDKRSGFRTHSMLCVPMVKNRDLVGVLQLMNKIDHDSFTEIDLDFSKALASQCAVAIENARLVEIELKDEQLKIELETARNIQQKILPKKLPAFTDIDIDVQLIPAKEIGGDYFNVLKIADNLTLMFIVDVTGKSVSAALIVSTIFSFLQTYLLLNKDEFDLNNFVDSLNKFLITATTPDKFATAWFGLYSHDSKKLESISAGHNPTYLFKKGEITEFSKGGLFLGSLELPYETEIVQLEKGDTIIFYTDGVTEAMNDDEEEFGDDRFLEMIKNFPNENSASLVSGIVSEVIKYRGYADQSDDITCGVFKVL